eukprot:3076285-Amphidinium_carterae.1
MSWKPACWVTLKNGTASGGPKSTQIGKKRPKSLSKVRTYECGNHDDESSLIVCGKVYLLVKVAHSTCNPEWDFSVSVALPDPLIVGNRQVPPIVEGLRSFNALCSPCAPPK